MTIKVKSTSYLDQENLTYSAELLRALAHPLRLQILLFIDNNKSTHVNKIYNTLGLEQSITSQHLRILREVDLVLTEREGKYIYYTVNYKKIKNINKLVNDFVGDKVAKKK